MSLKLAILNLQNADYCCVISEIIKNEAINLMQYLLKKRDILKYKSVSYINMSEKMLTFGKIGIKK